MKQYKVRITACSNNLYWYEDKIGKEYIVKDSDDTSRYECVEPEGFCIHKTDCKILHKVSNTYLVVDGKQYSLEEVEKHIYEFFHSGKTEWYASENSMFATSFKEVVASLRPPVTIQEWRAAVASGQTDLGFDAWKNEK